MQRATDVSPLHPVVINKFMENARVHSGDATLVLPPQRTYLETVRRIRRISRASPRR